MKKELPYARVIDSESTILVNRQEWEQLLALVGNLVEYVRLKNMPAMGD